MSGFAERRAGHAGGGGRLTLVEARAAWSRLVWDAANARLADPAMIADLQHRARALPPTSFPVGELSAKLMAEALLAMLKAVSVAERPERRAACLVVLKHLADALDLVVHEDRARQAAATWGRNQL